MNKPSTKNNKWQALFGTNAEARKAIETRKRKRQAAFETGGGFAQTQTGTAGLTTVGQ